MNRRAFLGTCGVAAFAQGRNNFDVATFDRERVLRNASRYLTDKPETVTAAQSQRSAGGLHDFFSEGDYWWPDPAKPEGPYIQRDGMTNPDNFVRHRRFLMKLSVQVPALAAAWELTKDRKYAAHAATHLLAWFVNDATRMNPDLQYAQAIQGRTTGRGTGVIDTVHLVEVARAVPFIAKSGALTPQQTSGVKRWFAEYANWMATSKNGIEERDTKNNHTTCWFLQVAAFAALTENKDLLAFCAERVKKVILPGQIEPDGSQPLELRRTKPYGYCLFNLEALTTLARIISETGDNLWKYETPDGRSIRRAIEYMYPFIADKSAWKNPPDVMYFDKWPMRQQALLFGGLAYQRQEYLETWKKLPADSDVDEVVRNYFIRQPVLWT